MAVLERGIWYTEKEESDLDRVDTFHCPQLIEPGRYHLYMSLACPFAHRAHLVMSYLGLERAISVSTVAARRYDQGWQFDELYPDPINGCDKLAALYRTSNPNYSGRVTVPLLWDKKINRIVCNDSAYMATDFATNWLALADNPELLVPEALKDDIIELNTWLHSKVNAGVYGLGFAKNQAAYNKASESLFAALDSLNLRLAKSSFLFGDAITLSDLFLLPTLVRFEAIYESLFKANQKRLNQFQYLYAYLESLMEIDRIRATVDIAYMKEHYYFSLRNINPSGIVPAGPELPWFKSHKD